VPHGWRTRQDPFGDVWDLAKELLETNSGLEARSLFEHLQRLQPGRFPDGQLRTFQRRVKVWRATEGPAKEVYFAQVYEPGIVSSSDFTWMNDLGIMIDGRPFDHLVYHFVLPYSNWETGSICFSESYESLAEGLQSALWKLGGATTEHLTDRLTTAVRHTTDPEKFTEAYRGLLCHYGMKPRATQAASPHENGDVEQRHYRLHRAVEQALLLRGSREFSERADYAGFLQRLFEQLNAGRKERFAKEQATLRPLPTRRLEACTQLPVVRVSEGSTISVKSNVYSVDSRLIGEHVKVKLYAERLEVWFAGRKLESIPRLRGENKHHINYRHIIEWFLRKPGAFEHYRYREDLFPTARFREAYDSLAAHLAPQKASKEYLRILKLAATESESLVDTALGCLLQLPAPPCFVDIKWMVETWKQVPPPSVEPIIAPVALADYDELLQVEETSA
jgi:transposase InsO family protein